MEARSGLPIIECRNVCIAYARTDVVRNVVLTVEKGEFLPFVGPNGAGKTTLLRAILGLIRPRCGRITTPFDAKPPGYVPQQRQIDPLIPFSVRQLVGMGLYPLVGNWRFPSRSESAAVDAALDRFDLLEHSRKTFSELSGGMRQKALVARAFVSGADVFVMDEPTSELDVDSEREVLEHLHRLSCEEGKTVLIAHHGLDLVLPKASSVCLMLHGRLRRVAGGEISASTFERVLGCDPAPGREGVSDA